jgi:hypothetical protein
MHPSTALLLHLDTAYRHAAEQGQLPLIAPRRENPTGARWLPLWETTHDGHRVTVLFSNTPLAHRLGKTHEWVVIYYAGMQYTVVTDPRGRRIVKGREREAAA